MFFFYLVYLNTYKNTKYIDFSIYFMLLKLYLHWIASLVVQFLFLYIIDTEIRIQEGGC
jgi:hypothetical protein